MSHVGGKTPISDHRGIDDKDREKKNYDNLQGNGCSNVQSIGVKWYLLQSWSIE